LRRVVGSLIRRRYPSLQIGSKGKAKCIAAESFSASSLSKFEILTDPDSNQ
jgi:hypothetical protein